MANKKDKKDKLKFVIMREIGVLSESPNGWRKEANIVSWNDRTAKFDLRNWNETHQKMGRGITLTGSEARAMQSLLIETDLSAIEN